MSGPTPNQRQPQHTPGLALPPGVAAALQARAGAAGMRFSAALPILAALIGENVPLPIIGEPGPVRLTETDARRVEWCVRLAMAAGDTLLANTGLVQFQAEPEDPT